MSKLARRLWKWLAATLASLLILLAIGVGLFRLAVPMVPELRADAEAMAERALGLPVHIGEIDLQWALFGPELVLTDVQLLAPDTGQPLVMAAQLDIIFGPLDFFRDGVPRPSHVRLHQPTLALERGADGRFSLSGYALPEAGEARGDWRKFLEQGLGHGRLTVYDGELHYRDLARNIDDWTLRIAEMTLASDGRHHELEGTVIPPAALGERFDIEFSAEGEPASPETWEWTLDFEADALRLAGWYRQLGWREDGPVEGKLALAGQLGGQGLDRLTGKGSLGITGLAFAGDPADEPAGGGTPGNFESVGLLWKVARDGGDFQVTAESLVIKDSMPGGRGAEEQAYRGGAAFSLHVRDEESGDAYPLEIRAFRLPLAAVAGLTRLLPADSDGVLSKARDIAERLAPRGEVRSLQLQLDTGAEPPRFHVEAEFHGLGLRHWQELPGFTRLNGSIRGDQAAGEIHLDGQDVRVDFGELFRTPLPAERLAASLSWHTATDGWHIRGQDIVIANPGITAMADFILDLPSTGKAFIDLNATARDVDLTMRSTWLPVGIMSDALIHWLDTAIIGGDVPEARLVLRGPLASFPYRDGSGTFDIRFETRNAIVEYAPGWPRVEGLRAQAHFHGPGLDIRVEQADVMGVAVSGGTARFGDLREGLLEVDAMTAGDMARAWEFLAATPLRKPLAGVLDALAVNGPMQARVALDIPLKNVEETRLTVDADLQGVAVHPVSLPWTAESLEGALTVTESTVTAKNLAGQFTGHPFTASITPVGSANPQAPAGKFLPARIRLSGRTPAGAFESFLPPAWLERLDGEFDWNGEMQVGDGEDFAIRIASDLDGLGSTLPAPLDVARPVVVDIVLPEASRIEAGFDMHGLGTGRIAFIETGGEWRFDRGRLSLGVADGGTGEGAERPALPDTPGLEIEGEVPVLDLGAWLAVGGAESDTGRPLVRRFAIDAARMRAGGLILENQSLSGTRLDGAGWELLLAGPATGLVRIPSLHVDGQAWKVVLERLHLPLGDGEGSGDTVDVPAPDPRNLPELALNIGDLRVGPVHLGEVRGTLQRTAIGYTTQDLSARGESFTLGLAGRWEVVGDEHYTSIISVLDSEDIGDTLAALGYEGGIDADDGRIEVNLAWHAAPMAMEYGMLEGTVSFSLEDGSLSEVSPGAGRLIGLLSLSALPRRLFLDFSDFFSEGLSFDTLTGDFLLTEGNAYTTNVRLEGPSLSALLVGRTGLAARDYDQLAIVDPGVSASLPVAGYLAAGPSVGAALLLLSQLLEAPLSDMTQVKYRITGSWDEPVIERVQESNAPKQTQPAKP